jgi:hypothetical protein
MTTSSPEPDRFSPTSNPVERALNAASGVATRNQYLRLTKTLTYSYLFVLPLIIVYEVGMWLLSDGAAMQVRIGADIMVKRLLALAGIDGTLWLSVVLLAIGAAIIWYERRQKIPIRPGYFGLMFGESAVYGVVIGMLVASFVSRLFSLIWPPMLQIAGKLGTGQELILSLGAGIYEELVFRLILVSLLVALLRLFVPEGKVRYMIAAVIGALIFSAVHYVGALGDVFTLQSFTFRFLMGLALNAIFLWRGFGIAAMTHALFDVFVTLM